MNFSKKTIISIFILATNFSVQECAIMEATIQIESDSIQMTSFLDRFKNFIASSHDQQKNSEENRTIDKFVQHNDSFQANYDFAKNLLTIGSSYSLLINGTDKKISDVKIIINFRFKQDSNERIILEDLYGNAIPIIGVQPRFYKEEIVHDIVEEKFEEVSYSYFSLPGQMLSFVIDITEPVIIAFLHIIVNGVLGHVLTTAFDHFYQGRVTI